MSAKVVQLRQGRKQRNATSPKGTQGFEAALAAQLADFEQREVVSK